MNVTIAYNIYMSKTTICRPTMSKQTKMTDIHSNKKHRLKERHHNKLYESIHTFNNFFLNTDILDEF